MSEKPHHLLYNSIGVSTNVSSRGKKERKGKQKQLEQSNGIKCTSVRPSPYVSLFPPAESFTKEPQQHLVLPLFFYHLRGCACFLSSLEWLHSFGLLSVVILFLFFVFLLIYCEEKRIMSTSAGKPAVVSCGR